MQGLYIASTRQRAGKTLLACSMGLLLQKRGRKVGFMKPLGTALKRLEAGNGDAYALTVQEVLGQDALPGDLTPFMLPAWTGLLSDKCPDVAENNVALLKKAYAGLSRGKDIMLVSGSRAAPGTGSFAGLDSLTVVRKLGLRMLLVERYDHGLSYDPLLFMRNLLGDKLAGVVINDVPETDMDLVRKSFVPFLEGRGIRVLGLVPHEGSLARIRAIDLAYDLGGSIVAGNRHSTGMVECFIIGSSQMENFLYRLEGGRQAHTAVIVGGDRVDLQLAALQGASCLILTCNTGPHEMIRSRAEEAGVPVIVVKEDTYQVTRRMSHILSFQKFRELAQIDIGVKLVERALDVEALVKICLPPKK